MKALGARSRQVRGMYATLVVALGLAAALLAIPSGLLAARVGAPSAFVDDLIPQLDSVAEHSPATATFQHVADPRLRPLAPRSDLHRRIDDWRELGAAIEESLRL